VIDGIVLGLGFSAGQHQGLLLAIALAIEFLFLGLSIAGAFDRKTSRWLVLSGTVGVSLGVPLGSLLALPIGSWPFSYKMAAFLSSDWLRCFIWSLGNCSPRHMKSRRQTGGIAMFFVRFLALTVLDQALRS
jgi:ZIP family zinc transporter